MCLHPSLRLSFSLSMPLLVFTVLCLPPNLARAASFDCTSAKAPDEVAICTHPKLSALDSEMGGLWFAYSRVPMLMGSNGDRHDEADRFLKRRKACRSDVACLTKLYQARNRTLRKHIGETLKQFNSCL